MTRYIKFFEKRKEIENENIRFMAKNFEEWLDIHCNQRKIKREKGYKH